MAEVWVPALLRPLCGGTARLQVEGATLGDVLRAVEARCPGFMERVVSEGALRPEIAIAIDGEAGSFPLFEPVGPASHVSILPAIGGG